MFAAQIMNSIAMMWALWTSVAVMPFAWIPPYRTRHEEEGQQWETCSPLREKLLGSEASTLLACFQGYCMLPGRQIGTCCKAVPVTPFSQPESEDEEGNSEEEGEENVQESELMIQINVSTESNISRTSYAIDNRRTGSRTGASVALPDVDWYYHSAHFSRVSGHGLQAWEDCMWLLRLQEEEPDNEKTRGRNGASEQQQQQGGNNNNTPPRAFEFQFHRRDRASGSNSSSSFITARTLSNFLRNTSLLNDEDEQNGEEGQRGGARRITCGGERRSGDSNSVNTTAFSEYAREFNILKPFLMYLAVPAASISMVNAIYMNIGDMDIDGPGDGVQGAAKQGDGGCHKKKAPQAASNNVSKRRVEEDGESVDVEMKKEGEGVEVGATTSDDEGASQRRCRCRLG